MRCLPSTQNMGSSGPGYDVITTSLALSRLDTPETGLKNIQKIKKFANNDNLQHYRLKSSSW